MNDSVWVPAAGFEERYDVSNNGEVRSWCVGGSKNKRAKEPKLLVLSVDGDGYLRCNLSVGGGGTRNVAVHVLMCASWHGTRPVGAQVRHLNGVRTDNSKDNLRWGTAKENAADMIAHGTHTARKGEANHFAKLTADDVRAIRTRTDATGRALAKEYGITPGHLYQLRSGKTWMHL